MESVRVCTSKRKSAREIVNFRDLNYESGYARPRGLAWRRRTRGDGRKSLKEERIGVSLKRGWVAGVARFEMRK